VISEALNYDTFFSTLSISAEIFSFLFASPHGYSKQNDEQPSLAFPLFAANLIVSSEAFDYSPNFQGCASRHARMTQQAGTNHPAAMLSVPPFA